MKGGLSKEVVSDKKGVSMGHITLATSKPSLTKRWSFTRVVSPNNYYCYSILILSYSPCMPYIIYNIHNVQQLNYRMAGNLHGAKLNKWLRFHKWGGGGGAGGLLGY